MDNLDDKNKNTNNTENNQTQPQNFSLSHIGFVFGILSLFFMPIVFGMIGIGLGMFDLEADKNNKLAKKCIRFNIVCMIWGFLSILLFGGGGFYLTSY